MRWLLVLALPLALLPLPATAQQPAAGPAATVLLFHPLDQVDPFGIPLGDGDPFSVRYAAVAAQTGQFDYPVFAADGLAPIQALPEPAKPYQGTLDAYEAAVAARLGGASPLVLTLEAHRDGTLAVKVEPTAPIQESQGQTLRLRVALAEDPVHYQPPAPVSNGVVDHRFTVRAYRDLGPVALAGPSNFTAAIPLDSSWRADRLLAAAWVQADGTPGRFAPTEVLQATHAPLGGSVRQATKGVLVEAYSATWCTPCLYGDLALEQVAIRHAGAQELQKPAARYFEAAPQPLLAVAAALAVGLAVAFLPRGGRP
jgi:thiol-disulfide isomerase/thioredoxin